MIVHRFVDLFDETVPEPDFVFLAQEATPQWFAIWKAGNLATPERFDTTVISSANSFNDFLADPELSPDGTQVIYCRAGHNATPKKSTVRVVDWDDTAVTELASESTTQASLQPTWSPDGTQILYRALSGSTLSVIKVMDADGSNKTTLYTGSLEVSYPRWNYDGTRIAWVEGPRTINVMDADGSNQSTVVSYSSPVVLGGPEIAWARTQNKIAFFHWASTTFTSTRTWRIIDDDGTNETTLHTIDRSSGYGPGDSDPSPSQWTWEQDDSALITTLQVPADPAPNHYVTRILTNGGGNVDVGIDSPGGTADFRPAAFQNRIYIPTASPITEVSSTDLDGNDLRVDFDGTVLETWTVVFHGFKGDPINI